MPPWAKTLISALFALAVLAIGIIYIISFSESDGWASSNPQCIYSGALTALSALMIFCLIVFLILKSRGDCTDKSVSCVLSTNILKYATYILTFLIPIYAILVWTGVFQYPPYPWSSAGSTGAIMTTQLFDHIMDALFVLAIALGIFASALYHKYSKTTRELSEARFSSIFTDNRSTSSQLSNHSLSSRQVSDNPIIL